jgi:hypothetical protein
MSHISPLSACSAHCPRSLRTRPRADFNDLFSGNRSVEFSRSLNPEVQTLDQWMTANKDRIPLGGAD